MKKNNNLIWTLGIIAIFAIGFTSAKGTGTKSKIGYINTNALWQLMPEKIEADKVLKGYEDEMVAYFQKEQQSLQEGVIAFQKDSANMSGLIKKQTLSKLMSQQESLQKLPEQANEEITKKQEDLYAPIRKQMQEAIDKVANENGYDYILDAAFGNIIFVKNEGDDILPLVKTKLNL